MTHPAWMIYGANGYTGELIAREARARGLAPTLGGRSAAVERLAAELGLPARVFGLDDPASVSLGLSGMKAVLHCAGPFSATSRPMLDGCLKARAHYLDITGEIDVFEEVFGRSAEIRKAGITAIPGVGFDVVPTDCLAALLKERLPDAVELVLAFQAFGKSSPGTTKTMIQSLGRPGRVRKDGRIVDAPIGTVGLPVEYKPGKPVFSMRIPWGDVSTAYYSTGVPNIETYVALPPSTVRAARLSAAFGPLLRSRPVQATLSALAGRFVKGPNAAERSADQVLLWGEARSASGRTASLRMRTPEGYVFTVAAALASVARLLGDERIPRDALTPSLAFGPRFALELPGVAIS